MKQIMLTLSLCVCILFSQAQQQAWLIVPGKSIGQVKIGWPSDSLSVVLGASDSGDAAMMKAWNLWYGRRADGERDSSHILAVFTAMRDQDTQFVRQIRVTSPQFRTSQELGAGSTMKAIRKAYPGLKLTKAYVSADHKKRIEVYEDKKMGIAFETANPKSKIPLCSMVVVFDPGDSAEGYLDYHVGFDEMVPAKL